MSRPLPLLALALACSAPPKAPPPPDLTEQLDRVVRQVDAHAEWVMRRKQEQAALDAFRLARTKRERTIALMTWAAAREEPERQANVGRKPEQGGRP